MKSLLKGAVRDHRLPADYKIALNQPMTTKRFLVDLKRQITHRFITKQFASLPLFALFGVALPYFFLASWIRQKQTGSLP